MARYFCVFHFLVLYMFILAGNPNTLYHTRKQAVSCFSCPEKCECSFPNIDSEKWIVNCSSANLTYVPGEITPAVEYLDLSNNHFSPNTSFAVLENFPDLKWLSLENVDLQYVTLYDLNLILNPTTVFLHENKRLGLDEIGGFPLEQICRNAAVSSFSIDAGVLLNMDCLPERIKSLSIFASKQFSQWQDVWDRLLKTSVNRLTIQSRGLSSIPVILIEKLRNLQYLNLTGCNISNLDDLQSKNISINRSQLNLNLASNFISTVPAKAFSIFRDVVTFSLDMSNNDITYIDPNALDGIMNIESLTFSNNPLGVQNFENVLMSVSHAKVKEMNFLRCNIEQKTMTKDSLKPLQNTGLKTLNLLQNRFIKLGSDNFYYIPDIENLLISMFIHAEKDTEATILRKLKYLYISHLAGDTGFITLTIAPSEQLEYLTINHMNDVLRPQEKIKFIFSYKLKYIRMIDVQCGSGFDFSALRELETIKFERSDCEGRHISVPPNSHTKKFVMKSNLVSVHLDHMFHLFDNMRALETLDLSDTHVILGLYTRSDLFRNILYKIQILRLNKSYLKELSYGFLHGAFHLKVLDLSQNRLDSLPSGFFRDTHNLEVLYLQENLIQVLGVSDLSMIRSLSYLDISDNKFRCGCQLREIAKFLQKARYEASRTLCMGILLNIKGADEKCIDPSTNSTSISSRLIDHQIHWIYCDNNLLKFFVTFSLILLVTILVVGTVVYRNRVALLILWYRIYEALRHPIMLSFSHDCYISYCDNDAEFVEEIHTEFCENPRYIPCVPPFSISTCSRLFNMCFRDKDFLPGRPISDDITYHMNSSKVMVYILSNQTLLDPWCQFEAEYGLWTFTVSNRRPVIIIEKEELKPELMCNSLKHILRHAHVIRAHDYTYSSTVYYALRALLSNSSLKIIEQA